MNNIDTKSVNSIRILSADAVQKANSGHPGLPLGAAPMAYELWANHMKHNPKNPNWINRDRFILSGGHGSALLYSLLHLFGYNNLSIDDLKNFRQLGSCTPGHPEYGQTVGVEATTGPLGAGMGMAVGMAISEAHLASKFNKENFNIIDHYTFVLGGDGCMMEGITSEAFSLAGTLNLNKLIVLYDSNNITIEGNTDIAFTENVQKRFEAFGFQTLTVEDGNNLSEIGKAIEAAKNDKTRPSMITIKTQIGFGCPAKQGSSSAHGEPLGAQNVAELRQTLNWEYDEPFYIPDDVYTHYRNITKAKEEQEIEWNQMLNDYFDKYPSMKSVWEQYFNQTDLTALLEDKNFWKATDKPQATRSSSADVIEKLKTILPNLVGGAADVATSTKTYMSDCGHFSKEDYSGRNLHFGVREIAMAAIGNGILLHGGLKSYVSTFFVFSDYLKPMARLAAIMRLPLIYIFTHDSIGVGEDGPTHQPVEQLSMFRAIPNFNVFRPADATETIAAWYSALTSEQTPTAIVLSRQNLNQLENSSKEALKGGYIIADSAKKIPDIILIATGSEVNLALEAKKALNEAKIDARVVSMVSMELFESQSAEYKESVLPSKIRNRIAIEAGVDLGWWKYVGLDGACITMNTFGLSAPANSLFEKFGFTVDNVVETAKAIINKSREF